ncbi:MAG: PIN domain-containing protein, partial [Gemmatimonadetes bacterium]|nr:PIN domain-containing protein [Gemmatimonadota bacterium]
VRRIGRAHDVAVPVIVLGEYRFGLLGSRTRYARESTLDQFVLSTRVLEITDSTTRHYAAIRHHLKLVGAPIPVNDTWIAALAREHSLPVLSADTHFDAVRDVSRVRW